MKIVHVVPHLSEEASGPSYSVPSLCQAEAVLGNDVRIACLGARKNVEGVTLDVQPQWPFFKRFAISPSMAFSLYKFSDSVDVIHNHSLWSMVNVASGWVVPGRKAKLVVSPRGTLSTWALGHSRVKKKLIWPLQKRTLFQADLIHVTSDDEYREVRALGVRSPVVILPNGIDIPEHAASATDATSFGNSRRTLLFLSRIHPKKGVDRLLHAWKEIEKKHCDWDLIVAGKGDCAHEKMLLNLVDFLGLKNVSFVGPLYGKDKLDAYYNADLFVLPTHSENFGMVVAEALAHACPVVVSHGAPWQGVEREGCGWWIDNNVEALVETLDQAMLLSPYELQGMGLLGRGWMERDFGWTQIGEKMLAAYKWVISGGTPPDCVRVD